MRGLVFVDTLSLSGVQWGALLVASALYLSRWDMWKVAPIGQSVLAWAFWNVQLSVDVRMLFGSAATLRRFSFYEFLSEFAFQNYVSLQPPFYTFYVSRFPVFTSHQAYIFLWSLLCVGLMWRLYGDKARFLLASPVWLLMSTQPSNDLILFGVLLCSLRCVQLRCMFPGALLFGVAYMVKPLAILLLPFMVLELRRWSLLSLVMWAGYVRWSLMYFFGIKQWDFLLRQLFLR